MSKPSKFIGDEDEALAIIAAMERGDEVTEQDANRAILSAMVQASDGPDAEAVMDRLIAMAEDPEELIRTLSTPAPAAAPHPISTTVTGPKSELP
jgi:hypothetical protein